MKKTLSFLLVVIAMVTLGAVYQNKFVANPNPEALTWTNNAGMYGVFLGGGTNNRFTNMNLVGSVSGVGNLTWTATNMASMLLRNSSLSIIRADGTTIARFILNDGVEMTDLSAETLSGDGTLVTNVLRATLAQYVSGTLSNNINAATGYITNLTSSTASITNQTSTTISSTTLNATTSYITNANVITAYVTNATFLNGVILPVLSGSPSLVITGAVVWSDGTNVCATIKGGAGTLTTNKFTMSAWP